LKFFLKGKTEVGSLSKRDRFVTGLALYAAEGNKTDGHIGFTNADPDLILFMSRWFREFLEIPEKKLPRFNLDSR
jgi:hypothetical protein